MFKQENILLPPPPVFSEEKLKGLLHYTDLNVNPAFEIFKSNNFFVIQSGAKGVSKSYSAAIETIYRLVNEINFNSIWCRNQYSHIKQTLRPMFENVLLFLKEKHNLDYTQFIAVYDSGLYWLYDDGGLGRAVFFENWEKTQAFQGKTLKNRNFRFGELVIDEPIEDRTDGKLHYELKTIYQIQKAKLPLLIQNTINRLDKPKNFKQKVKFFYNIFSIDHFLIQEYHKRIIPFVDEFDNLNLEVLEELIKEKFIFQSNPEFQNLGIDVVMYSKFFVPQQTISKTQLQFLNNLESQNYRLWLITVAGFGFKDESQTENYFLRNLLFKPNGEFTKNIEIISETDFYHLFNSNQIVGIYDGFDCGISDKSSWVRIALTINGQIIVVDLIEDLKKEISNNSKVSRHKINHYLAEIIKFKNQKIIDNCEFFNSNELETFLFTDNDIICEWLNLIFEEKQINSRCFLADRRDGRNQKFGIISRQNWQKLIFQNKLIKFVNNNSLLLLKNLAQQVILPEEVKRNEKINPEIYDIINAFEMAASIAYKQQYLQIAEINNYEKFN